ncbi:MAG: branched-chain amino acid ABC transporter permease [Chloroflexi bacterium]|nr:MAG: branched-chain amino acid ABC transporter permease [Chloroflexota bacterium]
MIATADSQRRWRRLFLIVGAIVAAYALLAPLTSLDAAQSANVPLLADKFWFRIATYVVMFVVMATAWNIIGGITGYAAFGNVAFFGIGAYTTGMLIAKAKWPFLVALPLAPILAALFAALVGLPLLRLRGHYFAVASLGGWRAGAEHRLQRPAGVWRSQRLVPAYLCGRPPRPVLLLLDVWRGGDRDRGHVVGAAQPVRLRPDRHPRKRRGRGGSRRQHDGVQGWGVRARRRPHRACRRNLLPVERLHQPGQRVPHRIQRSDDPDGVARGHGHSVRPGGGGRPPSAADPVSRRQPADLD